MPGNKMRGKGKFSGKVGAKKPGQRKVKPGGGQKQTGDNVSEPTKQRGRFGKHNPHSKQKDNSNAAEKMAKQGAKRKTAEQILQDSMLRTRLPSPSLLALQRMVASGPKSIGP